MKLGDVYYGSAVGHRKILRFADSDKQWKVLNQEWKNWWGEHNEPKKFDEYIMNTRISIWKHIE